MQQVCDRWKGNHGLGYDLYLIQEDVKFKDPFFSLWLFDAVQRAEKQDILLGDVDPLYTSDEQEVADENESKNRVSVERTEERDEKSAIHVWPD